MSYARSVLQTIKNVRADRNARRAINLAVREASSSTSMTESWQRPIPEGSNAAYDLALQYLEEHRDRLASRAERLRARSESVEESEKRALADRANALLLQAKLSDPGVRWAFEEAGGRSDSAEEQTVFSAMAKEKWVNEGGRDLLMQRITTMSIVPDLVPPFCPVESMDIIYPAASGGLATATQVTPGQYLLPSQTVEVPRIRAHSFRTPAQAARYNTLVMVDADRPNPATNGFVQYVHWIVPNVLVDASTSELALSDLAPLLPYQPPHPSVSTPYHRYAFFLLQQPSELPLTSFQTPADRAKFDLRRWVRESGFKGDVQDVIRSAGLFRQGGKKFGEDDLKGRELLDLVAKEEKVVSRIYKDVLAIPEPVWKKAPKEVKYGTPSERAAASKFAEKLSA